MHHSKITDISNDGDLVAQLVEQYTFNVWVLGSNPSGITERKANRKISFFCLGISGFEGSVGRVWDQADFLGEYQKFPSLASLIQISLARRRT